MITRDRLTEDQAEDADLLYTTDEGQGEDCNGCGLWINAGELARIDDSDGSVYHYPICWRKK